jgi:hypothetical protein
VTAYPHSAPLRALAAQIKALANLTPLEAMVQMGPLLDSASPDDVMARLGQARTLAAQRALDQVESVYEGKDYGRKAALARASGLSEATVSYVLAGHRKRPSRSRRADPAA